MLVIFRSSSCIAFWWTPCIYQNLCLKIRRMRLPNAFAERIRRTLSEYLGEYLTNIRRILPVLGEREYFFGEFAKTLVESFIVKSVSVLKEQCKQITKSEYKNVKKSSVFIKIPCQECNSVPKEMCKQVP